MAAELVRASNRTFSGQKSPEFAHDWHQITIAFDGALKVRDISGAWTVPAGAAAWVPADVLHGLEPLPRARARTIYIRRDLLRRPRGSCAVVAPTPLVHAIAGHISAHGALPAGDVVSKRLAQVLVDQLLTMKELPLFVPQLRTTLARRVASALEADPSDTPRIADLAAALDVSGRTIERAFLADSGMTIGEWRQRSRICRAIRLLAEGMAVKDVALESGYSTATAFIIAFKKYAGTTPGRSTGRS